MLIVLLCTDVGTSILKGRISVDALAPFGPQFGSGKVGTVRSDGVLQIK